MTASDSPAYIPRHLTPMLQEALADTPVVCLLGPRQCGKSTLARHCDPERTYINLDDRNYLELALRDPEGFIDGLPDRVAIDEIQRVPELTLAIKRNVDSSRRPGRFLLTGSANLLQLPRLADSLAGRMECLYLHPLTEAEKHGAPGKFLDDWLKGNLPTKLSPSRPASASTLPHRLVAGGYPDALTRNPKRARRWQHQYLQSIIERDIHDVADIRDGQEVARLLEYLSHQTASLLNVSALANALGHTRPTIERYLGVLEKLFLIRRLPAWHSNRSKRLVKAAKIHVCDSGLAAALADLNPEQWNSERTRFGHLLESFVVQQVVAAGGWHDSAPRFSHYRDKDQQEVDLVMELGGKVWGIEVKAAATIQPRDGRGLMRLAETAGRSFAGGLVLYDGNATLPVDPASNIYAAPLGQLWDR
ncbi:MAG: AAA family ATPase [Gammaproteobacteria bacterium HGW-Gammaproteobacteria-8]|nr:MAG: AAA family ATPase [Gammaproteobacteria bacterium HGW-Gammaproteobacteria-8]